MLVKTIPAWRGWRLALLALSAAGLPACSPAEPDGDGFGAASRHNLRAMLADSGDVLTPRTESARLAARRDSVMRAYIAGRGTGAERAGGERIKVAPVGDAP